jgi:transposase InsO family protein
MSRSLDGDERTGHTGHTSHSHTGKLLSPSRRRQAVRMLQDRLGLSERRACQIAGQHRSTQRREPCVRSDDAVLRGRLRELSRERPRWGYRRAHAVLREEGWQVNRKRVQRLWRAEGLRVTHMRRKRRRLGVSTVPATRAGSAYIEPGSPWQSPYVESFGSRVRDELLAVELFSCLAEAKVMVADWRPDYNEHRPHSSLAMQPPARFARAWRARHKPFAVSLRSPSGLTPPDSDTPTLHTNNNHRLSQQVDR